MQSRFHAGLAALILLISVGPVLGQTDVMDVSIEMAEMSFCGGTSAPFEQITAYLLVINPSDSSGISGWEANVTVDGAVVAGAWTLSAGLDVDPSAEGFQVGIGTGGLALPAAPAVVLATYTAFVQSASGQVHFYLDGVPGSTSFNGVPGYAGGSDAGDLRPLTISTGSSSLPVLSFNDPDCSDPPYSTFDVLVSADNGIHQDLENHAATDPDAADDLDGLDAPSAPLPPGGYVQASFFHPDWSTPLGQRYDGDVRLPYLTELEAKSWLLQVATDNTSRPVTLSFAQLSGFDVDLYLRDHDTGGYTDLRTVGLTYSYTPNPSGENFFDLIIGHLDFPLVDPVSRPLAAGWSMIGLPLASADATLLNTVLDDAVGPVFAMEHDVATGYRRLGEMDPLTRGRGYWIGTEAGFEWSMSGTMDSEPVLVDLEAGWNLIGYPLWFPSHVNGIQVLFDGSSYTWPEAVAAGLVGGELTTYDGLAYESTTSLDAWHGYWVAAYVPGLRLEFSWELMPTTLQRPWDPYADLDDPNNWRLEIAALGGDQPLVLGVCERASDGFDASQDRPKAPVAPSGRLGPRLAFPHEEWSLETGAEIRGDIRSPQRILEQEWRAVLTVAEPGPVTLTWNRKSWGGAEDLELILPERSELAVPSLRAVGEVTLVVGDEPLTLLFRTPRAGTGVETPEVAATVLTAVPNPFNPRTEIRFTAPRTGRCSVRVYDLSGRCVRTLDAGVLDPGTRGSVVWLGRDDSGRELASGQYFARLLVDGRNEGGIARMSLIR